VVAVRLRLAVPAALAALAAGVPAPAAAAPMPGCATSERPGGEWRSYGRDYNNSRTQFQEKIISAADAPMLTPAWTFSTAASGGEGDITGTPAVADGCMYVATNAGWVFAVNADTGKLVWKARVPHGGGVPSSVAVAQRVVSPGVAAIPARKARRCSTTRGSRRARRACARTRARAQRRARARARAKRRSLARCSRWPTRRYRQRCRRQVARKYAPRRRGSAGRAAIPEVREGTVYVSVLRTQKGEGCAAGDSCNGPYVAAFDQASGQVAWASRSLDDQRGTDMYASPVVFEDTLIIGVGGGDALIGSSEEDRYKLQGSLSFLDAGDGRILKKTWTIHPPRQPDDEFAGAGVWATPAIDPEEKVAIAGTANPYNPKGEHKYANAVLKWDIDRSSPRFGEIVDSYKGLPDEYLEAFGSMPCVDVPGNIPPYPSGLGSCGDLDLDFGSSPNLFRGKDGRKLIGVGQKAGVYHVIDARTMDRVWTQVVGPPSSVGGILGSTAHDGTNVYGPITVPGYLWSLSAAGGTHRWVGPIADGVHWGPPTAVANGVVYTVGFSGFLDAYDARTGALLAKRPLPLGGTNSPTSVSWGGVSIARNTIFAAVGTSTLDAGYVVAFRPGTPNDVASDVQETVQGLGGGGGGPGGPAPTGPAIVAGPGAASAGYLTPTMVTQKGGPLQFINLDVVQHDVVADRTGPDGQPLFRTPLIGTGQSAAVEGLDRVEAGQSYPFFCSLHPGMRGTLSVR
jgi:polyvinyl alcohol dehydrogenase (cytochrome)